MNLSALLIVMLGAVAAGQTEDVVNHACVVLHGTVGNKTEGEVHFEQIGKEVKITGRITDLSPGKHGFHIHMFGDCSAPDAASAGVHFNPAHADHGGPTAQNRHVGDLGNVEAGADGVANFTLIDGRISLTGANSILGRALIIHAKADDLKSQPSGEAGSRLACGVVGIGAPK